jgi:uridine phosphorylase
MMDFFVREVRSVVDGQLAIIRFGSCGSIGAARAGSVVVQNGAFAITRNYNYFSDTEEIEPEICDEKPYNFTKVFHADSDLFKKVESELIKSFGKDKVFTGLNATCDSFYSSQARKDDNFRDYNSNLISTITEIYPETISLEMETFMLFHLAKSSTSLSLKDSNNNNTTKFNNSIKAASAAMVFADRITNDFISPDKVHDLQKVAREAVLNALVDFELIYVHPDDDDCVWNKK